MRICRSRTYSNNAGRTLGLMLAFALFVAPILSGCDTARPQASDAGAQGTDYAGVSDTQTLHLQLYFLSNKGYYLTTEMRTVRAGQGVSWAEIAVRELLNGPKNSDSKPCLPEGTAIKKVVVAGRLANVYLGGAFDDLSLEDEFAARSAITNTLCAFQDIDYVGVYGGAGHRELRTPAAMSRSTDPLDQMLAALHVNNQREGTGANEWVDLPLYFMDTRGMLLLPEVRSCRTVSSNLADTIVQELMKGPSDPAARQPVLSPAVTLRSEPALTVGADGTRTVTLDFSGTPSRDLYVVKGYEALPYAAIAYSITSCMPEVDSVVVEIGGEPVTKLGKTAVPSGRLTRGLFEGYEGIGMTLYFPNEAMDTLLPVERAFTAPDASPGLSCVRALVVGPLEPEDDRAWPVVPSSITEDDVLSVKLHDDLAIVDVSSRFAKACADAELSLEEESVLVYSIVDTLTNLPGVKRVQFLVEGKTADTLGGAISVRGPIMRNVGIIG